MQLYGRLLIYTLILTATVWDICYCPHFSDKETEPQISKLAHLRSHNRNWWSQVMNPRESDSRMFTLNRTWVLVSVPAESQDLSACHPPPPGPILSKQLRVVCCVPGAMQSPVTLQLWPAQPHTDKTKCIGKPQWASLGSHSGVCLQECGNKRSERNTVVRGVQKQSQLRGGNHKP